MRNSNDLSTVERLLPEAQVEAMASQTDPFARVHWVVYCYRVKIRQMET